MDTLIRCKISFQGSRERRPSTADCTRRRQKAKKRNSFLNRFSHRLSKLIERCLKRTTACASCCPLGHGRWNPCVLPRIVKGKSSTSAKPAAIMLRSLDLGLHLVGHVHGTKLQFLTPLALPTGPVVVDYDRPTPGVGMDIGLTQRRPPRSSAAARRVGSDPA